MRVTDIKGISPTNYKKGMLFLNKYRTVDMFIMVGAFIWAFVWMMLLLFVFVPTVYSFLILVILIPVVAIALVQPMSNYHNNLEYILLAFNFSRRCKYFSSIVNKVPAGKKSKKKKNNVEEDEE